MISLPTSSRTGTSAKTSVLIPDSSRTRGILSAVLIVLALLFSGEGSVAFAQSSNGTFGAVGVGTKSSVISLVFTFAAPDTLASITVLTQGAAGLDFADAGSDTCIAGNAYSAGQSCTVNVTFTPRFAGNRLGAVVLEDSSGNTISTGRVQGTGVGPQISFQPGVQSTLGSGLSEPASVVVDGSGDVYFTEVGGTALYEMLAVNGSVPASPTIKTVAGGFGTVAFITQDGSGNIYVADTLNNAVKEILAVNGSIPVTPTIKTLGSGFVDPGGIAVDATGNVYVSGLTNGLVQEIIAVNGSIPVSPTIKTLSSGFSEPIGLAVDGAGNVYVASAGTPSVKEILAVNGNIPASPTINTLGSGFSTPYSLGVDASGDVYVADYGSSAVKEIVAVNGSIPSSPAIKTWGSGFSKPGGLSLDGAGNLYVADTSNNRVEKLDFADPPNLTFAATQVGATSSDSPRTITIANAGNAVLNLPIPSSGNNPGITTDFTLNSSGASDCPLLNSESPAEGSLAVGASCQLPVSFSPTAVGAFTGLLVLTDNDLNAAAPNYVSQSITLSGTGTGSFTLGALPASMTMTQGSTATSTITVTGVNGFTGSVNLAASGLPYGVTASFSPNPATGSTVLTLIASSVANLESSAVITISGTSGALTETTTVLLTVNPANFTLSESPSSLILNQGSSITSTVTVTDQNGFAGSVNLTAPYLPSGVTASFSPNPTTGTSVLTLTASSSAATGTYYLGASGTSGAEVASAPSFALRVFPPAALSLSAVPSSMTVAPGNSTQSPIEVDYENGLVGNVILSAAGLPSGVSASFPTNPATGTGTSIVTFAASSSATPGTYNVTVTGVNGAVTATTTVVLTVSQPAFSVSSSVSSSGMIQGTSLTSMITILPQPGFSGNVTLAASGLPSGVTASFSQNPTSGNSLLTIATSASATIGSANIVITGTSGTVSASTMINIQIVAPSPSFTVGVNPASMILAQGQSGSSLVSVIGKNGFSASLNLSVYGLPSGVVASFSPNPTTGTSVLMLTANSSAVVGTYNLIVAGTQGPGWVTESTTLVVTLTPPPGFVPSTANFGSVNIGTASPAQQLTYTFGSAVTLGSTAVLTQGAPGLDFADAGSDSCVAGTAYVAGQSCTVNVTFTPGFSGTRYGALVLNDSNGNVIATGYLSGTGAGPQINFLPNSESNVASSGLGSPNAVAVDASGNIYIADSKNNVLWKETLSAGNYTQSTVVTSSLNEPSGVAVDGGGSIYIADTKNNRVLREAPSAGGYSESVVANSTANGIASPASVAVDGNGDVYFIASGALYEETPSAGGYIQTTIPYSGISNPTGIAVDGSGNVYIADSIGNQLIQETLSGGAYTQSTVSANGLSAPIGVAVDGNGNVYIANTGNNQVIKETLSAGGYIQSTISTSQLNSPSAVAVDGGGNVFIGDGGNGRVLKEDFADPPGLSFANTVIGSISSDSPKTVTVENTGNAPLSLLIPPAGSNPTISPNFTLNSTVSSACPLLNSSSTTPGTLAAGTSCQLPISFAPNAGGTASGTLMLTDNNLNAVAPAYASQTVLLSGTATPATPAIIWATPAAISYGTALSAKQLNASSSVAGTFTYSPAAGTILGLGSQALTVTFTPANTTNYSPVTGTVNITVNQATPTVSAWPTASAIAYGQALISSTLTGGSASTAGIFAFTTPATTPATGTTAQSVTFTPTDTTDYTAVTGTVNVTVNKATPTVTLTGAPASAAYESTFQVVATTNASTTASITASGACKISAGTVTITSGSGTCLLTATWAADANYLSASATQSTIAATAIPTIAWATPAAITYGTALSATQLDATDTYSGARVGGTLVYTPALGTVLGAGAHTLSVVFTPSNTSEYASANGTVTLQVNRATPKITWAKPATISYGTPLSATQLNATASVPGTFVYSPAAGAVLTSGSQTLSASFTPTDSIDYGTVTATTTITVGKVMPAITWPTPASISYGTALSGLQLDASASASGTFVYSPGAGAIVTAGAATLSVTFTPTDTTDYYTAKASVALQVVPSKPTITWATPPAISYGTALSGTQLNATANFNGAKLAGTLVYTPASGTVLGAGARTLSVAFTPSNSIDYTSASGSVSLAVNQAAPKITWAKPAAITYGTPLSATQLNATASVPGTFVYSPAANTVLPVGTQTLSVIFTPSDSTDYIPQTATTTITVK